jgi:hypothetical protein
MAFSAVSTVKTLDQSICRRKLSLRTPQVCISSFVKADGLVAAGTVFAESDSIVKRHATHFAPGPIPREHLRGLALAAEFASPVRQAARDRERERGRGRRAEQARAVQAQADKLEAQTAEFAGRAAELRATAKT